MLATDITYMHYLVMFVYIIIYTYLILKIVRICGREKITEFA